MRLPCFRFCWKNLCGKHREGRKKPQKMQPAAESPKWTWWKLKCRRESHPQAGQISHRAGRAGRKFYDNGFGIRSGQHLQCADLAHGITDHTDKDGNEQGDYDPDGCNAAGQFQFFSSSIAIKRSRICGIPKYPSPHAAVETMVRAL